MDLNQALLVGWRIAQALVPHDKMFSVSFSDLRCFYVPHSCATCGLKMYPAQKFLRGGKIQ